MALGSFFRLNRASIALRLNQRQQAQHYLRAIGYVLRLHTLLESRALSTMSTETRNDMLLSLERLKGIFEGIPRHLQELRQESPVIIEMIQHMQSYLRTQQQLENNRLELVEIKERMEQTNKQLAKIKTWLDAVKYGCYSSLFILGMYEFLENTKNANDKIAVFSYYAAIMFCMYNHFNPEGTENKPLLGQGANTAFGFFSLGLYTAYRMNSRSQNIKDPQTTVSTSFANRLCFWN